MAAYITLYFSEHNPAAVRVCRLLICLRPACDGASEWRYLIHSVKINIRSKIDRKKMMLGIHINLRKFLSFLPPSSVAWEVNQLPLTKRSFAFPELDPFESMIIKGLARLFGKSKSLNHFRPEEIDQVITNVDLALSLIINYNIFCLVVSCFRRTIRRTRMLSNQM
ncbi:hypothetical protein BDW72DRAFT_81825 [Aspergillus terricola var. indicus]